MAELPKYKSYTVDLTGEDADGDPVDKRNNVYIVMKRHQAYNVVRELLYDLETGEDFPHFTVMARLTENKE